MKKFWCPGEQSFHAIEYLHSSTGIVPRESRTGGKVHVGIAFPDRQAKLLGYTERSFLHIQLITRHTSPSYLKLVNKASISLGWIRASVLVTVRSKHTHNQDLPKRGM